MLLLALLLAADPRQQSHRLANDEPEVRIDARGRTGICDVLRFSPDGRTLYAAGEDKVVHRWAVAGDRLDRQPPLAWNTLRERRGAIYAAALDPARGRLAVAGLGKRNADVAVFDLAAGRVTAAVEYPPGPGGRHAQADQAVWALAFDPAGRRLAAGNEVGAVWEWAAGGPARLVVAGDPDPKAAAEPRAVWVGYLPQGLAFARRDRGVFAVAGDRLAPLHAWTDKVRVAHAVAASGDGSALAATPLHGFAGNGAEVWWPATGRVVEVAAPPLHFPDRAALDATGRQLAVAYIDRSALPAGFAYDHPAEVWVYDLTGEQPRLIARSPRLPACPDQLAFHPDGRRLALADRNTHATSLWAVGPGGLTKVFDEAGDAATIWAVGMAGDDWHLSFKTRPAAAPGHPNRRGDGPWTTFNLDPAGRGWAAEVQEPAPPLDELGGWKVEFGLGKEFLWRVVEPDGTAHELAAVWDHKRDDLPRCYTFLKGPTEDRVWLAVGHLWGVSVYDLAPGRPPVRVRKLVGHAGPVTALAPTNGGRALVSAGADHTIALWNLADFAHQPVLGAGFEAAGGTVKVLKVADGSPADEAGLSAGFEVREVRVPDGKGGFLRLTAAADILSALAAARPARELAFADVRRPDRPGEVFQCVTQCLHRPAAKFVPLADGGWVVHTYRQCFYDSSADGDRAIQWLVSKNDPAVAPDVFPVGDFRAALKRPDKVTELLTTARREPAKPALAEKYPPAVAVAVDRKQVPAAGTLAVTVAVTPRPTASGRVNRVESVAVWLNGHRQLATLPGPARQVAGERFELTVAVPAAALRVRDNRLSALALAADGGWGTKAEVGGVEVAGRPPPKRKLFAVSAGIKSYAAHGLRDLDGAAADAGRLQAAFKAMRAAGGYADGPDDDLLLLQDRAVTKPGVLAAVAAVGGRAGPDDLFVLTLSGHGLVGDATGNLQKPDQPDGVWYFATPGHPFLKSLTVGELRRPERVRGLFLSSRELLGALGRLGCPTLLVLDSCHAGRAAGAAPAVVTKNAPERFRPHGFGPVVLAACEANEEAIEVGRGVAAGAVFTAAVVKVVGGGLKSADADKDDRLTADELLRFVRRDVDDVMRRVRVDGRKVRQTAVASPGAAELARLVLAEW